LSDPDEKMDDMELTFEGPITGGDLPACVVLRCTTDSSYLLRLVEEDNVFGTVERVICDEHKTALEAGEPYRWDPDQHVMLMGTDRTGDGRFIATEVSVSRTLFDQDSALGAAPEVLTFTNETGESLVVAISQETAESLAMFFGQR
jgi:hypothetical protein